MEKILCEVSYDRCTYKIGKENNELVLIKYDEWKREKAVIIGMDKIKSQLQEEVKSCKEIKQRNYMDIELNEKLDGQIDCYNKLLLFIDSSVAA